MPTLVVVTGRRRPHEFFLLVASIPLGVGMLATRTAPQSVIALMPRWVVTAWAAALVVSGVVGVAALFWQGDTLRALRAESGALLVNAGALASFAIAAFVVNGWRAWFAGGYFVAWAAADVARSIQIRRDVIELTRPYEVEHQ